MVPVIEHFKWSMVVYKLMVINLNAAKSEKHSLYF